MKWSVCLFVFLAISFCLFSKQIDMVSMFIYGYTVFFLAYPLNGVVEVVIISYFVFLKHILTGRVYEFGHHIRSYNWPLTH